MASTVVVVVESGTTERWHPASLLPVLLQVVLLGATNTGSASSQPHCLTAPASATAATVLATSPPVAGCKVISMESSCLQTVVFAQILLGVALPCGAAWVADWAARRKYLKCCWQQLSTQSDGAQLAAGGDTHQSSLQAAQTAAAGQGALNQPLVDHPLEYVVNYKVLSVCSVYLVVGLWLLLGELVGGSDNR